MRRQTKTTQPDHAQVTRLLRLAEREKGVTSKEAWALGLDVVAFEQCIRIFERLGADIAAHECGRHVKVGRSSAPAAAPPPAAPPPPHPDEAPTLALLKLALRKGGVPSYEVMEATGLDAAGLERCIQHLEIMCYKVTVYIWGEERHISVHANSRPWADSGRAFLEPNPGYYSPRWRGVRVMAAPGLKPVPFATNIGAERQPHPVQAFGVLLHARGLAQRSA